jgi:hypothetical protein
MCNKWNITIKCDVQLEDVDIIFLRNVGIYQGCDAAQSNRSSPAFRRKELLLFNKQAASKATILTTKTEHLKEDYNFKLYPEIVIRLINT